MPLLYQGDRLILRNEPHGVSIDETWDVEQLSSSYIANLLKATRRFVGRGNRADSEQPKQKEYQTTNAKSTNEVFVDCVADNESKDDEAGYNNEEMSFEDALGPEDHDKPPKVSRLTIHLGERTSKVPEMG